MTSPTQPRRAVVGALLALVLALTSGGAAHAFDWPSDPAERPIPEAVVTTAEAEAAIATKLDTMLENGKLGKAYSLHVVDVESGRVIADRRAAKGRIAASNTKLFTAVAALEVLGASTRFETQVRRKGRSKAVTLVGGGDSRLTNGKLRRLAAQTADALRAKAPKKTKGKRLVRVRLDDTRYQGAAKKLKTWRQGGYNLRTIQPVRSIMRKSGHHQDAAASAAKFFAKHLDRALPKKWRVSYTGRTKAPAKGKRVATVQSPTVKSLVKRVLLVSDNQVAEGLLRELALAEGRRPTFAAGARVATRVAKRYGVDMSGSRLADGSGLSPANTIAPRSLTDLLRAIADVENTALHPILYSKNFLPVAGESGTLAKDVYYRFQQREAHCAVGKVVGKTGSLDWERALSGLTVGEDGRLKAFSVIANKLPTYSDRLAAVTALDHVAAIVNGCGKA